MKKRFDVLSLAMALGILVFNMAVMLLFIEVESLEKIVGLILILSLVLLIGAFFVGIASLFRRGESKLLAIGGIIVSGTILILAIGGFAFLLDLYRSYGR